MDKKKVKELLNKALNDYNQVETCDDGSHCALISMGASIEKALKELSKSDWVSVEDGLPPRLVMVEVCNKLSPEIVWQSKRIENENSKVPIDKHGFVLYDRLYGYRTEITHWKPIEKLEE